MTSPTTTTARHIKTGDVIWTHERDEYLAVGRVIDHASYISVELEGLGWVTLFPDETVRGFGLDREVA